MMPLDHIRQHVAARVDAICSADPAWPCRKGCDDCCRSLASVPVVSMEEWRQISAALDAMPAGQASELRTRIRESASALRPVTCPLLDTNSGSCLVYEARPIACRSYGFYAERGKVLGCDRIVTISTQQSGIVWGNHTMLEQQLDTLGPATELFVWLDRTK